MLDLSILEGFPETIAIGCKTAGEGVHLFYPVAAKIGEKTVCIVRCAGEPEGQEPVGLVSS